MINLTKEQQQLKQKIPKIPTQKDVLYQNQIDLSEEFMSCDWMGKDSLIMAETQVGKTGVMLAITQQIVDYSFLTQKQVEDSYEFLLWSPPDNHLEEQTKKRIENFEIQRLNIDPFSGQIKRVSNKNLSRSLFGSNGFDNFLSSSRGKNGVSKAKKRIELESSKNFVVFVDEAHYGQGRESIFDNFRKFCKTKKNVSFVYITATPSPFVGERKTVGDLRKKYNLFYLVPADSYYSMEDCFRDNRIIDIEPHLNLNKKVNFENWIDEIVVKELIQKRGNKKGAFIVRLPNQQTAKKLQASLNKQNGDIYKQYGISVGSRVFNSELGNITDLESYLKALDNVGPNSLELVLIINALGQGKTMDNSNIIGWYEYLNISKGKQKYNNEARLIQSIGRNLGNIILRKDYPIWTHKSTIEMAIKQNNEMSLIGCKSTKDNHIITHLNQQTSTHVSSSGEKLTEMLDQNSAYFFSSRLQLEQHLKSIGIKSKFTLKTSSGNSPNDICGVLVGKSRHTSFKCGLERDGYWVAHFDSMNKIHQKSWNNMSNKFKQKIVLIPIKTIGISATNNESSQK